MWSAAVLESALPGRSGGGTLDPEVVSGMRRDMRGMPRTPPPGRLPGLPHRSAADQERPA
jgi:hypothetical protein